MKRWASVLLVLSLFSCFPKGWRGAQPLFLDAGDPFKAGPYLLLVEQGTMAIVVKEDLEEPPVVEWWVDPTDVVSTSSRTATSSSADVELVRRREVMDQIDGLWAAVLTGLPYDTGINYRVLSTKGESRQYRFLAGASRGRKLRFAAFGDTRTGHQVHRELVEAMANESIEFVIHSGDLVEFGGKEEQWDLFFKIEAPVMAQVPMFAAVGNHDNSQRNNFRRHFVTQLYAEGNRYFYQDWGDVRVVVIDSEIEFRAGSEQYSFLEDALRGAAKNDQLIFMSLHYPPWSSGSHGSNLEVQEILGELAPRFGVEVILAGHDHNYERTKPIDGVTYIVAASGGANIRRVSPNEFSLVLRTEPHFVLFDVDKKSLVGRAINLRGNTFDNFIVTPNPPRE